MNMWEKREAIFRGRDFLIEFLSQHYEITGEVEDKVTRPDLYSHYKSVCEAHLQPIASIVNVGRFLSRRGVPGNTRVGGRNGVGQVYAYTGLRRVMKQEPDITSYLSSFCPNPFESHQKVSDILDLPLDSAPYLEKLGAFTPSTTPLPQYDLDFLDSFFESAELPANVSTQPQQPFEFHQSMDEEWMNDITETIFDAETDPEKVKIEVDIDSLLHLLE